MEGHGRVCVGEDGGFAARASDRRWRHRQFVSQRGIDEDSGTSSSSTERTTEPVSRDRNNGQVDEVAEFSETRATWSGIIGVFRAGKVR